MNVGGGLPVRPLGQTGWSTPVIGFGVSGPLGAAVTTADDIERLVKTMLAGGAGLFDTAPFYGDAERRLGRALQSTPRERFLIATKGGTVRIGRRLHKRYDPQALRESLENSLRTLGLEQVDIYLLHGAPPETLADPAVAAMLQVLKREGLTRALGATLRSAHELQAALAAPWLDVIQAPLWQGPAPDWPQRARAAGKGAIAIEAMRSPHGLRWPTRISDAWYLARALRDMAVGATISAPSGPPADRLSAALQVPGVSCVLTTTTRIAHARANLAVAAGSAD